jgi:hypothetical protein
MPPKSKSKSKKKKKKKRVESKPPALECTLADPPPSMWTRLMLKLLKSSKTVCAHPGCTAPAHKKCSVCEGVRYCSKAHQALDWPEHKLVCEPVDKPINHGTRFDTPEPSPHANPTGLWYKADSGGSNAGLKTEYIMGNAGLMQELQMLAWRHRGVRPVIVVETTANGEDAHDPKVTLVPESTWSRDELFQPIPGSIEMPYPIAQLFRQVDVDRTFVVIYELRHIPFVGTHGRYVRGGSLLNFNGSVEKKLIHDAEVRRSKRDHELMSDDWTRRLDTTGGYVSTMPEGTYELQRDLQRESEEALGGELRLMFMGEYREWFERIPIGTKVRLKGMTGEGAKFNNRVAVVGTSCHINLPCITVLLDKGTAVLVEMRACELLRPSNTIARRASPAGTN